MRQPKRFCSVLAAILLVLSMMIPLIARSLTAYSSTVSSVCPTYWTCSDIGVPTLSGGQSLSNGVWTVQGAGGDIYGTLDQFHAVYQTLPTDGDMLARVVSQTNTNAWAKAGIMVRQTTDPSSPYYAVFITPGNGVQVQWRTSQGGNTSSTTTPALAAPIYLRVRRVGTVFQASYSTDGSTYSVLNVGGTSVPVLTGTLLAGMAVTSHNSSALSTATFDNLSIKIRSMCSFGWSCTDVGNPSLTGNSYFTNNTYYIMGSGATTDQFQYDYQSLAGDGSIQARLLSQSGGNATSARAGLMMRQGTATDAAFYACFFTPASGLVVQFRTTAGGIATQNATIATPAYVKIGRAGNTYTTYTSADGTNWTAVPNSAITLATSGTVLTGLAVGAGDSTTYETAAFDSVSVAGGSADQGPFMQANGQQFTYNTVPITLYGSTMYTSRGVSTPNYNWTDPAFTDRIDWDLNLAQRAGFNIIRPTDQVNDLSVNVYDPVVWANMDYLVRQAALRHMWVVMDMSTFANHLKQQNINPYNPSLWTQFIQFVTARYRNAPSIANYSLDGEVNPVNATSGFKTTAQGYVDFFNGVTTQTYNGDGGHHLIAAGGLSFLNQPSYGLPWQQIFSLPHVNMATIHTYPGDSTNPETTDEDLTITTPMVGTWARQNNKPFEIEEYGFIQAIGDARRAAMIQTEQTTAFSNGATGLIVWNMGPEVLGGSYDVNPGYPLAWQKVIDAAPPTNVPLTATPGPTSTPERATNTPLPPPASETPVPPPDAATDTPVPPTATATDTPVPPTATSTPIPPPVNETPVPPPAAASETPASSPAAATDTPAPPPATDTVTPAPPPPTSTPFPAIDTDTPVPPPAAATDTPVPPTATSTPIPATDSETPGPPTAAASETPVPPTPAQQCRPRACRPRRFLVPISVRERCHDCSGRATKPHPTTAALLAQ